MTDWLNGWRREGDRVYVGNGAHCAGCGLMLGVFSIALTEEDIEREFPPTPKWPFPVNDCPVHMQPPEPEPEGEPCQVCGGSGRRRKRALP